MEFDHYQCHSLYHGQTSLMRPELPSSSLRQQECFQQTSSQHQSTASPVWSGKSNLDNSTIQGFQMLPGLPGHGLGDKTWHISYHLLTQILRPMASFSKVVSLLVMMKSDWAEKHPIFHHESKIDTESDDPIGPMDGLAPCGTLWHLISKVRHQAAVFSNWQLLPTEMPAKMQIHLD